MSIIAYKDALQQEAIRLWVFNHCIGLVCAATGVGKTRIAILAMDHAYEKDGEDLDILIVVPFSELKDTGWPEEITKWERLHYMKHIEITTYHSLATREKRKRSLIILDEAHHLTPNNARFFIDNEQHRILSITATPPDAEFNEKTSEWEPHILSRLTPLVFNYTIKQATEEQMVSDYGIWVIDCFLDETVPYVKAGTPKKPFKTTESAQYNYMMREITKAQVHDNTAKLNALYGERMRFLYNLYSKTEVAKRIIAKLGPEERTIVFCGSIKQAELLCGDNVYHSKSGKKALRAFKNKEINILGVCKAVDEGENIEDVHNEIIVQATSKPRQTVQRVGRAIRFKPGHKARIFLLRAKATVDERWVKSTLEYFDSSKIKYFSSKNF